MPIGGIASGIAGLVGGIKPNYRGKTKRALEAAQNDYNKARDLLGAFSDASTDNPLFQQSFLNALIPLRREIAQGIQTSARLNARARARGLTGGVRSDREDEGRYRAATLAYHDANVTARNQALRQLIEGAGAYQSLGSTQAGLANAWQGLGAAEQQTKIARYQQIGAIAGGVADLALLGAGAAGAFGGAGLQGRLINTGLVSGGLGGSGGGSSDLLQLVLLQQLAGGR